MPQPAPRPRRWAAAQQKGERRTPADRPCQRPCQDEGARSLPFRHAD
eukprot:gene3416-19668_t